MTNQKKRRAATGASSMSQTQDGYPHSTSARPLPGNLRLKVQRRSYQTGRTGDSFIQLVSDLLVESSWNKDEKVIRLALLSGRGESVEAAFMATMEEGVREAVQA